MKWKKENNCLSVESLQYYIDGELSQNEQKIIENHLSDCEHCQAKVQEFKNLIECLSREMPLVKEDEIIVPDFHPPKIQKTGIFRITKIYWWSAAAVLLMLVSINIFKKSGNNTYKMVYVYQEISNEIDANTPWHEQSTTLYILTETGEIIDKIENF